MMSCHLLSCISSCKHHFSHIVIALLCMLYMILYTILYMDVIHYAVHDAIHNATHMLYTVQYMKNTWCNVCICVKEKVTAMYDKLFYLPSQAIFACHLSC